LLKKAAPRGHLYVFSEETGKKLSLLPILTFFFFRGNRKRTLVGADPEKQRQEISANKQQVYEILPPPNTFELY